MLFQWFRRDFYLNKTPSSIPGKGKKFHGGTAPPATTRNQNNI